MKLENRNMRKVFKREMTLGFIDQPSQGVAAPFLDPSNSDHDSTRYAKYNYHKVISEYIKDSLNHNKQLIGIDMANDLKDSHGGLDQSIGLSSIDVVGFNPYYNAPNELIKSSTNTMKGYVDNINFLRNIYGLNPVPVIIPEGGTSSDYHGCSNYTQDLVDKMTLPFTGIAGYNSWIGYDPIKFSHENDVVTMPNYIYDMWDNTIRVKNHMNGDDVINTLSDTWGAWSHGMEKRFLQPKKDYDVEAVEMQAYVSSNKKIVVGYIRNRTYNLYTRGQSGTYCENVLYDENRLVSELQPVNQIHLYKWDAIQNNKRIKVKELLNVKKYNVDFYNQDQWITDDSKFTSLSGSLKIRFPFFDLNHPVIWFVAKRDGYSGMMQNDDITEDTTGVFSKELLANERDTLSQRNKLSVFPNPFEDYFIIESPVDDEVLVQEPTGKVVMQQKILNGQNRIQSKRLTSGMYFVRFVDQNRNFKIIKH